MKKFLNFVLYIIAWVGLAEFFSYITKSDVCGMVAATIFVFIFLWLAKHDDGRFDYWDF